jgi:ammonium transporter Rh
MSITGSTLTAVFVSRAVLGKIDMEVMLNSTLAGGVLMGAACDIITGPGFAMLAGCIAGACSALGYLKLNTILQNKIGLHDTCGVLFLHGIPGTLGGFVSVICCAAAEYNFGPIE